MIIRVSEGGLTAVFLSIIGLRVLCTKIPPRPRRKKTDLRSKTKVHDVDMEEAMAQEAIDRAIEEFEQYTLQTDIASHLRNFFENKYGGVWHCVIGNNFDSAVHNKARHFIHFNVDAKRVLLYGYDGGP